MSDLNTIFIVTVVDSKRIIDHRCWGWYRSKEDAWTDLNQNADLFFESFTYDYAVIEEVGPGIMAAVDAPSEPEWIKVLGFYPNTNTYEFERLTKPPPFAEGMVCWGMG